LAGPAPTRGLPGRNARGQGVAQPGFTTPRFEVLADVGVVQLRRSGREIWVTIVHAPRNQVPGSTCASTWRLRTGIGSMRLEAERRERTEAQRSGEVRAIHRPAEARVVVGTAHGRGAEGGCGLACV